MTYKAQMHLSRRTRVLNLYWTWKTAHHTHTHTERHSTCKYSVKASLKLSEKMVRFEPRLQERDNRVSLLFSPLTGTKSCSHAFKSQWRGGGVCVSPRGHANGKKKPQKNLHRNAGEVEVDDPFHTDGVKNLHGWVFFFMFFSISLFLQEYMKTL